MRWCKIQTGFGTNPQGRVWCRRPGKRDCCKIFARSVNPCWPNFSGCSARKAIGACQHCACPLICGRAAHQPTWRGTPSATPATQKAAASTASSGNQARHQSQPSAISAMPATQSDGRCHQVPRLPRRMHVHVAECHACHAKSRGVHGVIWEPSAPPVPAQCMPSVPRLPSKMTVDVTKCHACHTKWRWMSPRATPATQSDGCQVVCVCKLCMRSCQVVCE